MQDTLDISIVIPFYNEEESLAALYRKIVEVLIPTRKSFEIIFVDDGSEDNSNQIVRNLRKEKDSKISLITFKSNKGKASALNEGFAAASGAIIFTMDADLQDDPQEIPAFLAKLEEGFDLVSGWKKKRHDPLEKRLPSKLFNGVTSIVSGIKLHDFNCGFKAYRCEVVQDLALYGELHRYIPALAHWRGFRVGEIPVQHHPREFGESKYGWKRYFKGFLDLFTIILITRFLKRPIHLFGLPGLLLFSCGIAIMVFLTGLQIIYGSTLGHKPLTYLGVLSILLGSQTVAAGLIAEMLAALKFKTKQLDIKEQVMRGEARQTYAISLVIPIDEAISGWETFLTNLKSDLKAFNQTCEIIFVEDGMSEKGLEQLQTLELPNTCTLRILRLRQQTGRSCALQAGFFTAQGELIATMATGQKNILLHLKSLVASLSQAHIVRGWRTNIPSVYGSLLSKGFNLLISLISGVKVHDLNCTFYGFRKGILDHVKRYGDRQRFYPLIVAKKGYRLVELPIDFSEFPRGDLKKKFKRIPSDFLDIFAVMLLTDFKAKPLHLFGVVGLIIGFIGFSINAYISYIKFTTGSIGGRHTLLLMGVTLLIFGIQWFITGLLGEIINHLDQANQKIEKDIAA